MEKVIIRKKAQKKFIAACHVMWGCRANGEEVNPYEIVKRFHIGRCAAPALDAITGKPGENNEAHFEELYMQYSTEGKKYNARKRAAAAEQAPIQDQQPDLFSGGTVVENDRHERLLDAMSEIAKRRGITSEALMDDAMTLYIWADRKFGK